MEETTVVTQGINVQPTDIVVTVQVDQMESHQTPEICQVEASFSGDKDEPVPIPSSEVSIDFNTGMNRESGENKCASKEDIAYILQSSSVEKDVVVQFAKTYSLSLASKRFNFPRSTIRSWMQCGVASTPKFNSPGQGRKISYSKETDEAIVAYFKEQVIDGNDKFTVQDLCSFAKELVKKENPSFNASTGWAYRFLSRHNLVLPNSPKVRTKKKKADPSVDYRGRPLSYSISTDMKLAEWVRQQQAKGIQVSNTQLRNYARTVIVKENPNFTASASWSQNFLLRHHLHLDAYKYMHYRQEVPKTSGTNITTRTDDGQSLGFFGASWQESSGFQNAGITSEVGDSMNSGDERAGVPSSAQECLTMVSLSGERDAVISSSPSLYQDVTNPSVGSMMDTGDYSSGATTSSTDVALALAYFNRLTSDVASTSQATTSIPGGGMFDRAFSDSVTSTAMSVSDMVTVTAGPAAVSDTLGMFCGSDGPPITPTGTSNQFINPENLVISNLIDTDGNLLDNTPSSILGTSNPNLSLSSSVMMSQTSSLSSMSPVVTSKSLSYATETDNVLAEWVTKQQSAGERVTFSKLRGYAKQLIQQENPHFNASVGWVTPFLLRHNLDLSKNKKKKSRSNAQMESMKMSLQESQNSGLPSESVVSSGLQCELVSVEDSVASALGEAALERGSLGLGQSSLDQGALGRSKAIEMASLEEFKDVSQDASLNEGTAVCHQQFDDDFVSGIDSTKKMKLPAKPRHTLPEKIEVVNLMRAYGMSLQSTSRVLGVAVSTLCGWVKMMEQKRPQIEAMFSKQGKVLNLHGAGRPLSYSEDKDKQIAQWVITQQDSGIPITVKEVCQYACSVIQDENPNFVASVSWARKFLKRHSIKLASVSIRKPSQRLTSDENSSDKLYNEVVGASNNGSSSLVGQTIEVESTEDLSIPSSVVTAEISVSVPEASPEGDDDFSHLEPLPMSSGDSNQDVLSVLEKPEYNIAPEIEAYLAQWTREKVSSVGCLSIQDFCGYTEEVIIPTDRLFVATLDWAFRFLHKHNLQLEPRPMVMESERRRILCEDDSSVEMSSRNLCFGVAETTTIPSNTCESLFPYSDSQSDVRENELSDKPTPLQQELAEKSKAAREFSTAEKEEVVRYANAYTLQKAAIKYGVAAPTVWRWRLELKLNSPRYNLEQKKKIIRYASQKSLKEAAAKFGLSTKTIQNWRKMFNGGIDIQKGAPAAKRHASQVDSLDSTELSFTSMEVPSQSYSLDHTYATNTSTTVQDHPVTTMMDTEQLMTSCASMSQSDCLPSLSASSVEVIMMPQECDIEYDISTDTRSNAATSKQSIAKWSLKDKVEILKFALEHSIREAGEKFGIKSSTLYNWKKSSGSSSQPDTTSLSCSSEIVASDSGVNVDTMVTSNIVSSSSGIDLPVSIVVESSGGGQDEDVVTNLFPTTTSSLLSLSPAESQFITEASMPLVTSPTYNNEPEVNFKFRDAVSPAGASNSGQELNQNPAGLTDDDQKGDHQAD